MEWNEPLHVNVDLPTICVGDNEPQIEDQVKSFEVVDYTDVHFPDIRHIKMLGRGSYGTVVQCFFKGLPSAAKLVENGCDISQLRIEAELLHGFRHENIVGLRAFFHGKMSGLVLELMEGGSLSELLHQRKHIVYQACHVLIWSLHVCKALDYLHVRNFVHRDIKPSNMLLSYDYKTVKLCDFGTTAEMKTKNMVDGLGTAVWMAPEVFRGQRCDQKCDIFSFGISLWEMVARSQPFVELNEENPLTLLWNVAENGLRPPRIAGLSKPIMELIERCWCDEANQRPCMEEIQKTLEAFIKVFSNAHLIPLLNRFTASAVFADSHWEANAIESGEVVPSLERSVQQPSPSTSYDFTSISQLVDDFSGLLRLQENRNNRRISTEVPEGFLPVAVCSSLLAENCRGVGSFSRSMMELPAASASTSAHQPCSAAQYCSPCPRPPLHKPPKCSSSAQCNNINDLPVPSPVSIFRRNSEPTSHSPYIYCENGLIVPRK